MNNMNTKLLLGLTVGFAGVGVANAEEIFVGDCEDCTIPALIEESMTWTADNTYNLQEQIFVLPGATLTIEAGTVVASTPTANGSGSLAVTRGAQIFVNGTIENPVIMTSTNDDFETWREAANEWGNLTVMGDAYISNSFVDGNSATCDGENISPMEGLVTDPENPDRTTYGGGNDDDDSGSISYLSIRYGGRVIGLANELNGLSLGGLGRATDIDHVEIMNNVDDGIEVWGGTVNLKYFSIWNIGDDSFDFDQGWRGKAQFGLIVQGYSLDADQGSGVGDNIFEHDGAENSDAQPVTTATIYNVTAIGQPAPGAGDGGTAWRDNARVQYRNCIWMDLGERLVRFDNVDGDGSEGYGFNGTLSWEDTWTTSYTETSTVNACDNPGEIYQAQSAGDSDIGQGFLAEITDSVFFRNLAADAYDESDARGVTVDGGSNPAKGNVVAEFDPMDPFANQPIVSIDRADPVVKGGKTMLRVISLDPRAANDAVTSEASAPDDGFFTPANYRGGFAPDENWLCTWTAADAYGFVVNEDCVEPADCPEDLDGDGEINVDDLLALLANWGGSGTGDINDDGTVNVDDLLLLLAAWGPCE
jgi:hypothetical protein